MPQLNRIIAPRGPRFFIDDGSMMFVLYLDGSTREGPRLATKEDSQEHPEAWAAFVADVEAQDRMRHADAGPHPWRTVLDCPLPGREPMITAHDPDGHEDEGRVGEGTAKPTKLQEKRAVAAAAESKA